MIALGAAKGREIARRVRNALRPAGIILLYHRVADSQLDAQDLCVSGAHFAEQLDVLRLLCDVVPLEQVGPAFQRPTAAITFDDGYADNLINAKPLLQRHQCPATVFVAAGAVGSDREFWWDELERLLLLPHELPERLEIEIGGITHSWEIETLCSPDAHSGWNVALPTQNRRQVAYKELAGLVRELPAAERERIVASIASQGDLSRTPRSKLLTMSAVELRELTADASIEIGGHTITHSVLSTQTFVEQRDEIVGCKRLLEKCLNRPLKTFSYPFGTRSDYNADSLIALNEAGFEIGCSNFEGRVRGSTDCLQLPRFIVRNWNGFEFEKRLRRWLAA